MLLDGAFEALRAEGRDFTVSDVLSRVGVSTRSFYRHFESKDALLSAMFMRDAESVASRLERRLSDSTGALQGLSNWIDEIFSFLRNGRRAERVAILGSIIGFRSETIEPTISAGRDLLVVSLRAVIIDGIADGTFADTDPDTAAELVAAAVMHAAGISNGGRARAQRDQQQTLEFVLRALGAAARS